MKELKGKVAVVTGAASGIGRGMAEAFAAAGMRIVLSDVEQRTLESATHSLRTQGADVHAVLADVSKPADVSALADSAVRKYGAVHVLCNNAGVAVSSSPSWMSTLDDWEWILGVNLMGVVHGIRTFLPLMIEQGEDAHIVNTASMGGLTPTGGALYSATKSAVVAISESVYLELVHGGFKPRMSVLCPGFVSTNILDSARNRPAQLSNTGAQPSGPAAEFFMQWFAEQIKQGLSPRAVGEQVLQAIRDERFYILPSPEWGTYVEHRMKQIVNGENPTLLPLPGM